MESSISLQALASAVGLGLLIGAVRERAQTDPASAVAGVRTHLLVALAGTLGAALGTAVLVAVLLLIGALMVASYVRNEGDPGLTGEVALPVTALLAALAHTHPGLAAGIAVVVAGALFAKQPLHELVREKLSERELRDGLLLAGAALVVLPLLPDEPVDPWGVLVPSRLWRMVVLILAVGMMGHIALRAAGARWGLPLAGFLAGFASSTAAVAGFGQRARAEVGHAAPAASAALFANLGSLLLFAGVVGAGAPRLLSLVALPLGAAAMTLLLCAVGGIWRRESLDALPQGGKARVFHLSHALLLAGLMAVLLLGSTLLQRYFGSAGVMAAAAAVAMVEVQAAAASLAQLAANGQLTLVAAGWGLVLLVFMAGVAKSALAFASGGARYGGRVATGLAAAAAAMALVQVLLQAGRA
ncbi:MAG TPA: DUF4010 domain-containing protein [Steroidobacteraceae bacterium]|nr:DUF4010 domain-containing protein [Steroidobacteraceae bacterium]